VVIFEVDIVSVSNSLAEDELVKKSLVLLDDRVLLQGVFHLLHEIDDVLHVDIIRFPLLLRDVLVVY
jgi:hypothetical protein